MKTTTINPKTTNTIILETKKTRSEIYENVYNYILDCIDSSDYGITANTEKEKIEFVINTFRKEYGYSIKKLGILNAFKDWLSGLPSSINIDYNYYDIIRLSKEFGSLSTNSTEAQEDRICKNWFMFIAMRFSGLAKRNKITFA